MTQPASQRAPRIDRNELLAELADLVRELTEPRTHTETTGEILIKDGKKRRWVRQRHIATHPSLMQELRNCLMPGVDGDAMGTAGYESRPSADLEPLRVWTQIRDESKQWCRKFGVGVQTPTAALTRLVSAHHTDEQLRDVTAAARTWVRKAKQATGWEPPPFTLSDRCPACGRRNVLTVAGDLTHVRCGKCEQEWPEQYIGILGQMLEQNRTHETLAAKCEASTDLDRCYLVAGHEQEHRGSTGRCWTDT